MPGRFILWWERLDVLGIIAAFLLSLEYAVFDKLGLIMIRVYLKGFEVGGCPARPE